MPSGRDERPNSAGQAPTMPMMGPGRRPGGGPMGARMAPPQKLKDGKGTLLRLIRYLRTSIPAIIAVFIFAATATLINVIGTRVNGMVVDKYIAKGDVVGLKYICIFMLAMYVLNALFVYIQSYIMIGVSQKTIANIRTELFNHLQELPMKFFDVHDNGDLMSRLTNDVDNVNQTLSQSVTQLFTSIITFVGMLVAMLMINPVLTLVALLAIPTMTIVSKNIVKVSRRYFLKQQTQLGELNSYIEEKISGQKVVKVFSHEEQVKSEFGEINSRLKDSAMKAQMISGAMGPISNLINNLAYLLVALVGAYICIKTDAITAGMLFSFILYMKHFTRPINEVANLFNTIQSALAGAERVFEVLDEPAEDKGCVNEAPIDNIEGVVEAEDVDFSYIKGTKVLKDASFKAEKGQTVALVGPTGAGKTTIVNLLTRFYDVDSGSIKLDGVDINDIERHSLRSKLGIVLQDTFLFSESIMENIRYGRLTATDEEVIAAAKMADCHHFITHLSNGYDTVLLDNGSNLSQGQRQLLAIARAILANPSVLILDEATSSIDTHTEMQIQNAMLKLMEGRTSFVIAHRLSTIKNADQILVIDHGEIIERGNHEELLSRNGFYSKLYNSQFRTGLAEA